MGVIKQWGYISGYSPDLFVDLAGSNRSNMLTFLMPNVVHYKKQANNQANRQHAVDNFLATLDSLGLKRGASLFPTIYPQVEVMQRLKEQIAQANKDGLPLVGLVPGVGYLRPHRAWIEDGWVYLIQDLLSSKKYFPVLIGGPDEVLLCNQITSTVEGQCLNLSGKLTLAETAALLKLCRAVVSADTGPAHLSVAVGTPVVGLYGPTYPQRSGPYGYESLTVDNTGVCECHQAKLCQLLPADGPGQCMRQMQLSDIWMKLKQVLTDL
jgi:ADP-heptose:LPS heptosyltransferase